MKAALPKRYEYSHWLSLRLHDYIAHMLKSGEEEKLFEFRLDFENREQAGSLADCPQGSAGWDWLLLNGHEDIVSKVITKQVMAALISDFCHFTFEALNCSQKGKLTVAYALLRKLLRENLFYLEWLLANPEEFMTTFRKSKPEECEKKRKNPEHRKEIIRQAIEQTSRITGDLHELIHDIRYNSSFEFGFAKLNDKAIHLITTHKSIRTEDVNFNFVFSSDDSRQTQWHQIYKTLPILLNHAVEVIIALMDRIADRHMDNYGTMQLERAVGMRLWADAMVDNRFDRTEDIDLLDIIKKLDQDCPECQKGKLDTSEEALRTFYQSGVFQCELCGNEAILSFE